MFYNTYFLKCCTGQLPNHLLLAVCNSQFFMMEFSFQAIQNPNDIQLQEKAWNSVCPLVVRLKRFYEFSLRLGEPWFSMSVLLSYFKEI